MRSSSELGPAGLAVEVARSSNTTASPRLRELKSQWSDHWCRGTEDVQSRLKDRKGIRQRSRSPRCPRSPRRPSGGTARSRGGSSMVFSQCCWRQNDATELLWLPMCGFTDAYDHRTGQIETRFDSFFLSLSRTTW